jgi:hypothetical protein
MSVLIQTGEHTIDTPSPSIQEITNGFLISLPKPVPLTLTCPSKDTQTQTQAGIYFAKIDQDCSLQIQSEENTIHGYPSLKYKMPFEQIVTVVPKLLTFLQGTLLNADDIVDWSFLTIIDDVFTWFRQNWTVLTPLTGAMVLVLLAAFFGYTGYQNKRYSNLRPRRPKGIRAPSQERPAVHYVVKASSRAN